MFKLWGIFEKYLKSKQEINGEVNEEILDLFRKNSEDKYGDDLDVSDIVIVKDEYDIHNNY